jgi:hypothetical protein
MGEGRGGDQDSGEGAGGGLIEGVDLKKTKGNFLGD